MAELFLKRTPTGFQAADEWSFETLKRFKIGDVYRANVRKSRNYEHHKLAFALLSLTFKNQERYTNFDDFRKAVALAAGHSTELMTVDGEIIRLPGSLSFDALDEVEFGRVMQNMLTVCAHILHDMDEGELAREVEAYGGSHV